MEGIVQHMSRSRIEPKKFGLWLGLGSITMMFVALTSAYIVRRAAGNWLEFELLGIFWISSFLILFSSISLEWSWRNFKKGNQKLYRIFLVLTLLLGFGFLVSQFFGWQRMNALGITLTGNPSESFIYVISGVHAAHVFGGIGVLIVAVIHAYMLPFFKSKARKLRFQLSIHYWHYVGALWIYLFIFFKYIQ